TGGSGPKKIQERVSDLQAQWAALEQLAAVRKKRLEEALAMHQFQADADDVDAWTLDALRIVSNEEYSENTRGVPGRSQEAAAVPARA
uniref:Uncharacterized protein n=1 Tax=Xiphophorus couchianus TaxID=32473 RepID=A0A3B5M0R4_9TELE